jgi:hypothetical protein
MAYDLQTPETAGIYRLVGFEFDARLLWEQSSSRQPEGTANKSCKLRLTAGEQAVTMQTMVCVAPALHKTDKGSEVL